MTSGHVVMRVGDGECLGTDHVDTISRPCCLVLVAWGDHAWLLGSHVYGIM